MHSELDKFIDKHMKKAGQLVPARLQTAVALLERLRVYPSANLREHLASAGSSGLNGHETWGKLAHERFKVEAINTTHGRRSSSLQDWGQDLLDIVAEQTGEAKSEQSRQKKLDTAQGVFFDRLRAILEQEPIRVRIRGWSVEAIIHSVLEMAESRGKSGEVAQYLTGAKLRMRFPDAEVPVAAANKGDRRSRSDTKPREGDFTLENAVIEVAMGLPDDKHLRQIADILELSDHEVWLLTRSDRVATWKNELAKMDSLDGRRVVITSVEAFVGQNITELGTFSTKGKSKSLQKLFELYNSEWVAKVGSPGMRIEIR